MKKLAAVSAMAGMVVMPASLAFAQDSSKYDPVMAKRADLRMMYAVAQNKAAKEANASKVGGARRDDTAKPVDRSRMVNFVNLLPKRADLRMRIGKLGIDAAYKEWMK